MDKNQKYKYLIKGGRHTDLKFVGETNDVVEAKQIIQDYINKTTSSQKQICCGI